MIYTIPHMFRMYYGKIVTTEYALNSENNVYIFYTI